MKTRDYEIAEAVRSACIAAAGDAWEDAGLQGLCSEGRWEVVIGALRALDLEVLFPDFDPAE